MTRSIHETRRRLEEARRWDHGDRERRDEAIGLVEGRLNQKRRYKQRALGSRASSDLAGLPGPLEIVTEPMPVHAHHPLSEQDIRRMLALFPGDIQPHIHRVHRRFGLLEDDMREDGAEIDPLTGRHGFDLPGGIWMPRLRGRFHHDPFEIDLFAYVYDESALRVPEVQTVMLWLEQALTLAHEVAHAWDLSARTARDRWALDETGRAEDYAQATARTWAGQVATSYFPEAYPDRAQAFDEWISSHTGISISLARIVEDLDRSLWGVDKGLFEICAKWGDLSEVDARVEIAEQFHFVDDFAPAREILRSVLIANPEHVSATILMGDIAVHEESWVDALSWTEKAILLAPGELNAHEDRVSALIGAENWADAVSACTLALALIPKQVDAQHSRIRLERARAFMELGDFDAAAKDLDHVTTHGRHRAAVAQGMRAESLVRQERWREAREESMASLRARPSLWAKALLTAAAWDAERNLGVESPKPIPTERHVELLRWHGRGQWVDRLIGLGLKPAKDRPTRRDADLSRPDGWLVRL